MNFPAYEATIPRNIVGRGGAQGPSLKFARHILYLTVTHMLSCAFTWVGGRAYFTELAGGIVFDEEADRAHPAPMPAVGETRAQ